LPSSLPLWVDRDSPRREIVCSEPVDRVSAKSRQSHTPASARSFRTPQPACRQGLEITDGECAVAAPPGP